MAERRKLPRVRALKGGKIAFHQHRSVIDCVVRNFTDEGALLNVPSTAGIPERFDFKLAAKRTFRPCRVIWRREDALGVVFE